jgi:hypothetical protein
MKGTFAKIALCVAATILISSSYIAGLHAQSSTAPAKTPATTNWIGCLVVGQNDATDSIAIGGPHPTVERQVEIGLRSDGILIWRKVANSK